MKKKVCNWGNYPQVDAEVTPGRETREIVQWLTSNGHRIPRGMGRCYGDSALSPEILNMVPRNRMLSFDQESGLLNCEAGVTLEEILDVFVPQGWFVPVTPGTKFVSIGGAIASDVHGKNHHKEGCFSDHLHTFTLAAPDGNIYTCSREQNSDIFEATVGGMGLTGVILDASVRLKKIESSYIAQTMVKARNLDEIMKAIEATAAITYSVAWIDCLSGGNRLGRSVLMAGEHAAASELPGTFRDPFSIAHKGKKAVPFFFPSFSLNRFTVNAFNALYYGMKPGGTTHSVIDYDQFFYPLDGILHWNRIYGKRGFTQYQFVVPLKDAYEAIKSVLLLLNKEGLGSFLAVLKYFGPQRHGMLSFPMEGYTLTLDFPINDALFPFLRRLDEIILAHGGRLYLTKDVRMDEAMFKAGYPNWRAFLDIKNRLDPAGHLSSLQSQRIGLT